MAHPIYVTYTPQTTGSHRICYKQISPVNDATYCCMLDNTVSTPGTPKTYVIADAGVTECDSGGPISPAGGASPSTGVFVYDGYVQPTCDPSDTYLVQWASPIEIVVVP